MSEEETKEVIAYRHTNVVRKHMDDVICRTFSVTA